MTEEADETLHWLEIIRDAERVPAERLQELISEAEQLTRLFAKARRTARSHGQTTKPPNHPIDNDRQTKKD